MRNESSHYVLTQLTESRQPLFARTLQVTRQECVIRWLQNQKTLSSISGRWCVFVCACLSSLILNARYSRAWTYVGLCSSRKRRGRWLGLVFITKRRDRTLVRCRHDQSRAIPYVGLAKHAREHNVCEYHTLSRMHARVSNQRDETWRHASAI